MSSPSTDLPGIKNRPSHADFMQRCLQLAASGVGYTAPNPMVGAILVHNERIIGEGFHEKQGSPHAEVNCIQSVKSGDRPLISSSTLYVSLEPCCHHGKTPPCTDLIIGEKIATVVIGCRDPFPAVNGKGIEILKANGIVLEYPVLEGFAKLINRRFFTFHEKKRPYIILKWAESANHKMAGISGKRLKISNSYSDRIVHKWRSEEAGILVGTNTALLDNPELTTRKWTGKNPLRFVLDQKLRLPDSLKIFNGIQPTIILNGEKELQSGQILFKKIKGDEMNISNIISSLHSLNVLSVLVEGGAKLLKSFIDDGTWDEIRVITNRELELEQGISSPEFKDANLIKFEVYGSDTITYYENGHRNTI